MPTTGFRSIPTHYAGTDFRSRLEARVAVVYDALGVEWVYEPESYSLGEGIGYRPDFYLPNWRAWVEVKPDPAGRSLEKVARFAVGTYQASGDDTYVWIGWPPHPGNVDGRYGWIWQPPAWDGVLKLTPKFGHQHAFLGCEGGEPELIDAICAARSMWFDPARFN